MKKEDIFRDTKNFYLNGKTCISPLLLEFARNNAGHKLLDVGCATGEYAKELKRLGFDVVGVDINPEYVKQAMDNGVESYAIEGQSLTQKFPEKYFDTVLLFEVLEHVDRPGEILEQVKKVAKKNILITVPNCTGYSELKRYGLTFEHMLEQDHVNFFTKDDLSELLKSYFDRFHIYEREPLFLGKLGLPAWLYYPISAGYALKLVKPKISYRLYAIVEL